MIIQFCALHYQKRHRVYFTNYVSFTDFLISKHLNINMLRRRSTISFLLSNSCFNLNILGLHQKYFLMYCLRKSWYNEHSKMKWNSSSSLSQTVHFLSSNGILVGLCHLPDSTGRLWEETINIVNSILNFWAFMHLRNVWKSKSTTSRKKRCSGRVTQTMVP